MTDATETKTAYKCPCGNDRFQLVSETQETRQVDVFLTEDGTATWASQPDAEVKTIHDLSRERMVECSSCLAPVPLGKDDPLYRGMLGVARDKLLEILAEADSEEEVLDKLVALIGTDDEEIERTRDRLEFG